jgi:NADH:ubiquinone oxidoreductase subunit 6 (subunit J)
VTRGRRAVLMAVMLGGLAVGLPLMLIFESPLTRIAGVLSLFAFIVSGVFLIADPDFLGADDEQP